MYIVTIEVEGWKAKTVVEWVVEKSEIEARKKIAERSIYPLTDYKIINIEKV